MLVSESKRFIFVHVQKTGGTSIRAALAPYCLPPPQSWSASVLKHFGLPRDWRRFRFGTHARLSSIEAKMSRAEFGEFFKFAFVRNPWEQLVSEFNAAVNKARRRRHRRFIRSGFDGFLAHEARRRELRQIDLLLDSTGAVGVDYVGRFERLEEDFGQICARLSLDCSLPHLNRFDHDHYRAFYTAATRDFVRRHWARDIESFGYEF